MSDLPREAVTAYFDGFEFPAEHCPRRRQAPRAEDALLAVLDLCDKADDGVLAPYYRAVETARLRDAITTALVDPATENNR